MLDAALDVLGAAMLLVACTLATIGMYGLLRRRDIFQQLHAAGLVTGPAAILVLLASVASRDPHIITSAFLVMVFVFITSSLSTHAIARAAFIRYNPAGIADARLAPVRDGDDADPEAGTRHMRVLLAFDGSPSARVAVDLAAGLAWPSGTVLRVAGVDLGGLPPMTDWEDEPRLDAHRDTPGLTESLGSVARELERRHLHGESVLLQGDPTMAIVEEALASRADLIVVGSRLLGTRSVLQTSVAGEIVDRAPCPVLVARGASMREILLATDGSEASDAAVDLVARWEIFERARIRVVSVSLDGGIDTGGAPDDGAAGSAVRRLQARGRNASAETAMGTPASSITAVAARSGTDLIVIGSRGRTGLRRSILGSVSREVLRSAECSVLVITA